MNELSTEVMARETHENAIFYHNRTEENLYHFTMEVKEIRDNRYYKKLGYSSFDDYCMEAWNVDRKFMSERISIAEQFSEDDFVGYRRQFGHKKTLFLARMEDSQREQAIEKGIPTDEGYKPIDEATQKEINEYRRNAEDAEQRAIEAEQAKKQAESQAEIERRERERVERENQELASREPQVIEKVIKDETEINRLTSEINQLKIRLNQESKDAETYRNLRNDIERLSTKRDGIISQINNVGSLGKFIARVEKSFEEDLAPVKYSNAIQELSNSDVAVESLDKIVSKVENWCREIRGVMKDKDIVEVIEYEE